MTPTEMNRNRIIEVKGLGKFYVFGKPPYTVIEMPSADPSFWGWIVVAEEILAKCTPETIGKFNAVYKLDRDEKLQAKLLIKDKDMADDICFACNRLRV